MVSNIPCMQDTWGYPGKGYVIADYRGTYSPDTLNKRACFHELPAEQWAKLTVMAMKRNITDAKIVARHNEGIDKKVIPYKQIDYPLDMIAGVV